MQALLSDDLHPVVIEVSQSMALLCCNTCFITAVLTAGTLPICAAGNKVKLLFTRTMRLALWLNSSFSLLFFSSQQSGVFFSAKSAAIKSLFCGRRAGRSDFKRGKKIKSSGPNVCTQSGCRTGLALRLRRGESHRHSLLLSEDPSFSTQLHIRSLLADAPRPIISLTQLRAFVAVARFFFPLFLSSLLSCCCRIVGLSPPAVSAAAPAAVSLHREGGWRDPCRRWWGGGSLVWAGGVRGGGESFPKVEAASIGVKTVGERRAQPGEG